MTPDIKKALAMATSKISLIGTTVSAKRKEGL
jgi:hypothetical protein